MIPAEDVRQGRTILGWWRCSINHKTKSLKTYVIKLTKQFHKDHPNSGEATCFADKIGKTKIHTIRRNYPYWEKRFRKIDAGEACISLRQWEGQPYKSKQVEIARLTKEDGIGLEKAIIKKALLGEADRKLHVTINGEIVDPEVVAINDGLSYEDWEAWFDKDELLTFAEQEHPLPVIHFTPFRYARQN